MCPCAASKLYLAAESVCCPSVRTATCGCPKVPPHSRSTSWTVNRSPQQHHSAGTWLQLLPLHWEGTPKTRWGSWTGHVNHDKHLETFVLNVPQAVGSDSLALREDCAPAMLNPGICKPLLTVVSAGFRGEQALSGTVANLNTPQSEFDLRGVGHHIPTSSFTISQPQQGLLKTHTSISAQVTPIVWSIALKTHALFLIYKLPNGLEGKQKGET